jgi:copper chaperone
MAQAAIRIDGMSCMHCVARVKKAIDGLAGVTGAEVAVGSATVEFDDSKLSKADIEQAITKAGYKIAG